ncbi:hypothetical protein EV360DRAFT_90552 [Lentinula raphanica]|nr:hypothetical protein EV360DRAFT_90552 [Lentinula raphanica]
MSLGRWSHGADLLLFFPRMVHKVPYRQYWGTNIPYEVKKLFYESILNPALVASMPEYTHQYTVQGYEAWMSQKGKGSTPQTIELQPEEFSKFVDAMKAKIFTLGREHPAVYDRFGSFFFAVTVKGTKDLTKTAVYPHRSLQDALQDSLRKLQRELGFLDFANLGEGSPGCESFYDIGINITPGNDPPLVGLWNADRLEESFAASGYVKGDRHNLNTLDRYGGLMAEMRLEHQLQSHVCYGSAYSLFYQKTRTADNKVKSFKVADVAEGSERYEGDLYQLERALGQEAYSPISYGVRREIRVGYKVVEALVYGTNEEDILDASRLVRMITWVSKPDWSFFCLDRLNALKQFQTQIRQSQPQPPNYVILSGLVSYLMQSITSTPVRVPSFVRKALGELRYGAVMAQFGQFFISDIDFKLELVIDEIEDRDTAGVYAEAQLEFRKTKPPIRQAQAKDSHPSFLSGEAIGKLLVERPYAVMRDFIYLPYEFEEFIPGRNAIAMEALELMRLFTCSFWVLLKSSEVRERAPRPEELEGVESLLKFWSWDQRYDALYKPLLIRTTTDGDQWGVESRKRFFPTNEVPLVGKWKVLALAYIDRYRTGQRIRSLEERVLMDKFLEKLFGAMQCLPRGTKREPWVGGKNQEVVLSVNPNEYRREASGVQAGVRRGTKGVMKTVRDARRDALTLVMGRGVGEYERKIVERRLKKRTREHRRKNNVEENQGPHGSSSDSCAGSGDDSEIDEAESDEEHLHKTPGLKEGEEAPEEGVTDEDEDAGEDDHE